MAIQISLNDPALYGNKYHFTYDELGRVTEQYSGSYQMADSDACWKRVYTYNGDNLVGAKDVLGAWNTAWEN